METHISGHIFCCNVIPGSIGEVFLISTLIYIFLRNKNSTYVDTHSYPHKYCSYFLRKYKYMDIYIWIPTLRAEEIITMIQRPKWRCSSMLWSMESMTRHKRSHGHPLHPGLAPDVLTLSCLWIQLGQDERVRLTACLSLTIIEFTAHVILISNTHSQQAHICKS